MGGVAAWVGFAPYGPSSETFVEIAPGTGTVAIAQELQKAGIIRSTLAFEATRAIKDGGLKAGEYRFDHPASVTEVYERMQRGDVYTITLVIPEGYNIFDVADAVQAAKLGTHDDFLKAEMQNATSVEGFLFPDTYKFARHATPLQILSTMVKRFGVVAGKLGLTPASREAGPSAISQDDKIKNVVTMASLVEREVHLDAERPVVAGVFENRLALGMPLQPTMSQA